MKRDDIQSDYESVVRKLKRDLNSPLRGAPKNKVLTEELLNEIAMKQNVKRKIFK